MCANAYAKDKLNLINKHSLHDIIMTHSKAHSCHTYQSSIIDGYSATTKDAGTHVQSCDTLDIRIAEIIIVQ